MAKKTIYLTESELKKIVEETAFNVIKSSLNENNNFERAKKAVKRYCNPQSTDEMFAIIHDIQRDIPYSRILNGKYLEGIIRLVYVEELDESQQETINDMLSIISSNKSYVSKYNGNFNGLYFEDLGYQFYDEINTLINQERQESAKQQYHSDNLYNIVYIKNFEEASKYSKYVDWCIVKSQWDFERYTPHGESFYICLRNGFESIPMEKGNNNPLDDYGLSMLAISVRKNGRLASSTTRWNETIVGNKTLNVQQISNLIGKDFYSVFIPR